MIRCLGFSSIAQAQQDVLRCKQSFKELSHDFMRAYLFLASFKCDFLAVCAKMLFSYTEECTIVSVFFCQPPIRCESLFAIINVWLYLSFKGTNRNNYCSYTQSWFVQLALNDTIMSCSCCLWRERVLLIRKRSGC